MSDSNAATCAICGTIRGPFYWAGAHLYCAQCTAEDATSTVPADDPKDLGEIKRALDCLADCIEETHEVIASMMGIPPSAGLSWEHKPEFNFGTRKKVGDD